jgi:hypothetical protein
VQLVQLNIPVQGVIDRQERQYKPFLERFEIRDDPTAPLLEVIYRPFESASGEHNPGDPSVFLRPNTRGWYCPAPYNAAACVWLGNIL